QKKSGIQERPPAISASMVLTAERSPSSSPSRTASRARNALEYQAERVPMPQRTWPLPPWVTRAEPPSTSSTTRSTPVTGSLDLQFHTACSRRRPSPGAHRDADIDDTLHPAEEALDLDVTVGLGEQPEQR